MKSREGDRLARARARERRVHDQFLSFAKDMGDKQEKLEFVNRLIAPEFTENDQVQVTKKVVDAAKYAIKPPNNASTKLGKEVVKLIEGNIICCKLFVVNYLL